MTACAYCFGTGRRRYLTMPRLTGLPITADEPSGSGIVPFEAEDDHCFGCLGTGRRRNRTVLNFAEMR